MKKIIIIGACLTGMISCKKTSLPVILPGSTDFKRAEAFLEKQRADSAFYYFDQAASTSKDSLEVAMSYNFMAAIQSDAGDYYGAQETLISSLKFLSERKEADHYCLASDYNELGMTSSKLQHYDSAIAYFDSTLHYSNEESYRRIVMNNQANAYREKRAYQKALQLYQLVLDQIKPEGKEYARVLNNWASTKWLQKPNYNAAPNLLKALNIRKQIKDLRGQNSSYTHLADYYSQSKPDSALHYALRMDSLARQINSPDARLDALQKLIKLSPATAAKSYFVQYEQLNDSLHTTRNAAKNQFALIRYHSEKNKSDNLRLQKVNAENEVKLIRERLRFYGSLIVFVLIILLFYSWYKRRKKQAERDKQEAVAENQRKASKQVHDTLANDLYRIMKMVQNGLIPGEQWLMENLNDVYKRSRNLSYDIVSDTENFEQKISELLKSFGTEKTRVLLVGNSPEFWQSVPVPSRIELKYILQELMVNMQKHSQATDVVIRFSTHHKQAMITYIDNGIGITSGTSLNNGLSNAETRMQTFAGKLTFDANAGEGLQMALTFPLA